MFRGVVSGVGGTSGDTGLESDKKKNSIVTSWQIAKLALAQHGEMTKRSKSKSKSKSKGKGKGKSKMNNHLVSYPTSEAFMALPNGLRDLEVSVSPKAALYLLCGDDRH